MKKNFLNAQNSKQGLALAVIAFAVLAFGAVLLMQLVTKSQANLVRVDETREKIGVVEKALEMYFLANGNTYPCPARLDDPITDADYGVASSCITGGDTCHHPAIFCASDATPNNVAIGTIPTRTLNLPDSYMYDQWGNRLTYAMTTDGTNNITVKSISEAASRSESLYLFSHGPNAEGAYNKNGIIKIACGSLSGADEENCNQDSVFIDDYWKKSGAADYSFDDINYSVSAKAVTPFFTFKTTSTLASFNPTGITFPSSDLVWTCEAGCAVSGSGNSPNLNLSGVGEKTIKVESASGFNGLTALNLSSRNLTEFFGESERALGNLVDLMLQSNQIATLGDGIGYIGTTGAGLRYMWIYSNPSLTTLPATIGNWKFNGAAGSQLALHSNGLTSLPDEIGNITGLAGALNISDQKNALNVKTLTSLPTTIGNLDKITDFMAQSNGLTSLPDEIGNIGTAGAGLRYMWIYSNPSLTTLPTTIGNWKFNGIAGSQLSLNSNGLTSLPDEIGNITGLVGALNISNNNLTELPTTIGNFDKITDFMAQSNALTSLPDEIGNIGTTGVGLRYMWIYSNPSLTTLPTTIGNWKFNGNGGNQLSLSSNGLTSLPDEIGNITGLVGALNISDNDLTELPTTIGNFDKITDFMAQSNALTSLPDEIGNIGTTGAGLRYMWIYSNPSLTTLPTTIGNWKFNGSTGTSLSLQSNGLTSLPDEIGNITGLDGTLNLTINNVPPEDFEDWINGLFTNRASNFCSVPADTPIISISNSVTSGTTITPQTYSQINATCGSPGFVGTGCSFTTTYLNPGCP